MSKLPPSPSPTQAQVWVELPPRPPQSDSGATPSAPVPPSTVRRRPSSGLNLADTPATRASSSQHPVTRPPSGQHPSGAHISGGHLGTGRASGPGSPEQQAQTLELQQRLGHTFAAAEVLAVALTHPSWKNERPGVTLDNQRLEFLGDLVVGLAVGDLLLLRLPQASEGELSVLKSQLVRESTLAQVARTLGVGPALRLGRGEDQNGGRERAAVLADALEAIVGAVFIDASYEKARTVVESLLAETLTSLLRTTRRNSSTSTQLHASTSNFKTALQEWLARAKSAAPQYRTVAEVGTGESRQFRVVVQALVDGVPLAEQGESSTVKAAENMAAERLFRHLTGSESDG